MLYLGTVTFSSETASGWQMAMLATARLRSKTANTTYVVSYHTTTGFYAGDYDYFVTNGVTNGTSDGAGGRR